MPSEIISLAPQLLEPPRGRNGHRVFYGGFRYVNKDVLEERLFEVGEFAFVRITPNEDPCIAEMQLCWRDEVAEVNLASIRLYFLPEQTDNGRQSSHGQHELLVASDSIVLRIDDLVGWITEEVEWAHGLVVPGAGDEDKDKKDFDRQLKRNIEDNKENLLGAKSPLREHTETTNGSSNHGTDTTCPHVVVLSYPRYCRFRAMLRRLEGQYSDWIHHPLVEALGGLEFTKKGKYHVHFVREDFEHESLAHNDQICDHLGPSLKSRYKRKGVFSRRARSPGSDSNASEEGRDNIRIQIENRMQKNNATEVCKKQEEFLKKLFNFMRERKTPINRVPNVGPRQVDLYDFYSLSQEMGGYESITCRKLWKILHDTLGGSAGNSNAAPYMRRHYERLLLPYERHVREVDEEKRRKKKAVQEEKALFNSSSMHSVPTNLSAIPTSPVIEDEKPIHHERSSLDGLLKRRMAELEQEEKLAAATAAAAAAAAAAATEEPAQKKTKQESPPSPSDVTETSPPRPHPAISSSPRLPPSPHTASPPTQVLPQSSASVQRSNNLAQAQLMQQRIEEELNAEAWRKQIQQLCALAAEKNTRAQQELMTRLMEQIYRNGPYAAAASSMLQALSGRPMQLPTAMAQLHDLGRTSPAAPKAKASSSEWGTSGGRQVKPEPPASPKLSFQPHRMSPSLPTPANGVSTPPPIKRESVTPKMVSPLPRPESRSTPATAAHASSSAPRPPPSSSTNDVLDLSVKRTPPPPPPVKAEPANPQPRQPDSDASGNGLLDLTVKRTPTPSQSASQNLMANYLQIASLLPQAAAQAASNHHANNHSSSTSSSNSSSGATQRNNSNHSKSSSGRGHHSSALNSLHASLLTTAPSSYSKSSSHRTKTSSPSSFNPLNPSISSMASLFQSAAAQASSSLLPSASSSTSSPSKSKQHHSSSVQSVPIPASKPTSNGKLPKIPQLIPFHDIAKSASATSQSFTAPKKSQASSSAISTVSDYNPTLPAFIPQNPYPGLGGLAGLGMNPMVAAMMRQSAMVQQAQAAAAAQAQAQQAAQQQQQQQQQLQQQQQQQLQQQQQQQLHQQQQQLQQQQQQQMRQQLAAASSEFAAYKDLIERGMMLPPGMGGPQLPAGGAAGLMQQYLQMMYGAGLSQPK